MASKKRRIPGLSRLRRVIEKVKFLLSFDATRWMISSLKRSSPPPAELRFKTPPSLLDCSGQLPRLIPPVEENELHVSSSLSSGVTSTYARRPSRTATAVARHPSSTAASSSNPASDDAFLLRNHRAPAPPRTTSAPPSVCNAIPSATEASAVPSTSFAAPPSSSILNTLQAPPHSATSRYPLLPCTTPPKPSDDGSALKIDDLGSKEAAPWRSTFTATLPAVTKAAPEKWSTVTPPGTADGSGRGERKMRRWGRGSVLANNPDRFNLTLF